jgi:formiminotetrahydrofolate cyclodeaminase
MKLVEMSVDGFVQELGSKSPAPGGGSVAALCGSLSAALCAMVARLTVDRKKYENVRQTMEDVMERADGLAQRLLQLVDEDTQAYNQVIEAVGLPKATDREKADRKSAMALASRNAAAVPLDTLRTVSHLINFIPAVIENGNPNCITDAGTAVQLIRTAAYAAAYNVRINLGGIRDQAFVVECNQEVKLILERIDAVVGILEEKVWAAIG